MFLKFEQSESEKARFCTSDLYRDCILCESVYRGNTVMYVLGYRFICPTLAIF